MDFVQHYSRAELEYPSTLRLAVSSFSMNELQLRKSCPPFFPSTPASSQDRLFYIFIPMYYGFHYVLVEHLPQFVSRSQKYP
jgi:hypothetical protein